MKLFKEQLSKKEVFDRLILNEQYAEAFAYAIDNKIEQEALRICINYVKEDDERTERERVERQTANKHYVYFGFDPGEEKTEKERIERQDSVYTTVTLVNDKIVNVKDENNSPTPRERWLQSINEYLESCKKRYESELFQY